MEKEFKKGDMVKIKINSQAARELIKDKKTREKWEKRGWIGYVVGKWKHKLAPEDTPETILVGVNPIDPNPDYLFFQDLELI